MPTAPLKVLYLSHACVLRANRRIIELLDSTGEVEMHLVVPDRVRLGPVSWQACQAHEGRYGFTSLKRLNDHVRMHFYRGLGSLLKRLRPQVIHLDYEAGSVVTLQAVLAGGGASIACTSLENVCRDFAGEARQALRGGHAWDAAMLWGLHRLERAMMARVSYLVANHGDAIEIYGRKGFRGEARLVPLGIDTEAFRPLDPAPLRQQLGLRGFVIGYVGRLTPEKGPDLVIQAANQFRGEYTLLMNDFEQYPNPSYHQDLLEMARRSGVADHLVFFRAPHEQVPRYMNCMDCLVLPSRTTAKWKEQYGRVIPEAMACGVPVVGSTAGNVPHLIGQDGLLFPEGDAGALASALHRLRADEQLRREFARRGREKAVRDYSCHTQCRLLLEIYQTLGARVQSRAAVPA